MPYDHTSAQYKSGEVRVDPMKPIQDKAFHIWLRELETKVARQVPSWNAARMYNQRMTVESAAIEFKKLLEIN